MEPEYSEEARAAKLAGTVLLRIVVDIDGKAKDIEVVNGIGLGLDEQAGTRNPAMEVQTGREGRRTGSSDGEHRGQFQIDVAVVNTGHRGVSGRNAPVSIRVRNRNRRFRS